MTMTMTVTTKARISTLVSKLVMVIVTSHSQKYDKNESLYFFP